ncbi:thiamine pyrophosphokinase 1 isoform X5 [Natator depressus]|uniref:thiamine pyrophosphokinase 1 isoform X5 n=1 Tax=Natator depressus TaxID=27790 RepID=UPI003EB73571
MHSPGIISQGLGTCRSHWSPQQQRKVLSLRGHLQSHSLPPARILPLAAWAGLATLPLALPAAAAVLNRSRSNGSVPESMPSPFLPFPSPRFSPAQAPARARPSARPPQQPQATESQKVNKLWSVCLLRWNVSFPLILDSISGIYFGHCWSWLDSSSLNPLQFINVLLELWTPELDTVLWQQLYQCQIQSFTPSSSQLRNTFQTTVH